MDAGTRSEVGPISGRMASVGDASARVSWWYMRCTAAAPDDRQEGCTTIYVYTVYVYMCVCVYMDMDMVQV